MDRCEALRRQSLRGAYRAEGLLDYDEERVIDAIASDGVAQVELLRTEVSHETNSKASETSTHEGARASGPSE